MPRMHYVMMFLLSTYTPRTQMAHLIDLKNILKHDQENLRNKTLEYINDLDDHLVNLKQKKYNEYLQQKAELERYIRANQLTFKTFK